ncbi:hypothetical protein ACIGZJ_26895 [Kitasatospora sp. NPDC052868]|uniref:hypothetical protein n=1 Tax=Kitasatospora sp. NPDC052868 TaxID=3364060 RepID=UPI0037C87E36
MSGYVTALYEHCPFLQQSVTRDATGWTVYEIAPGTHRYQVEAELFRAGVQAAERIRLVKNRPDGTFVCENIVILGAVADTGHSELMAWPHWALKHLYGPVGVMFGKFAQGVQEFDRSGRRIPAPPCSFLPVRASVRLRDPRLLRDTPDLAQALAIADDDGRNVFESIPCEWKAVREWASSLPVPWRR